MTVFSDEVEGLREAVATLLAKRSDSAAVRRAVDSVRGYDEELWRLLCDQIGVAGLAVPERFGGAGASLTEVHVVLEELGRTLTPSPMLGSAVLGSQLLLLTEDDDACDRLLPGIAAGTSVAAVAWADEGGRWGADAVTATDGRLTGTAHYVLDGDVADVLLVIARDEHGVGVYEVDPDAAGVTRMHTPSMDITRRLARVELAHAAGTRLAGDATTAMDALQELACVALSAEQVGAAARALEMTVDYTKIRVQFGRPIGSFQALKHRMADLYVLVESARSASYAALAGTIDASVAKVYCSEALSAVAAEAIQLHGGIAITWEHDAHLYFKRAHGSAALFGSPGEHVAILSELIGSEPV
jgi:alkylation response protein AidB-like acyl-CoA dehydrogenase